MNSNLTHRVATRADLPQLHMVMNAAIEELQKPFLSGEQIDSSRAIMGIDTQLVDDGTYFIIEIDGAIAGCGGWSRRATLYGGDQTSGRDAQLLDPLTEPARIRAMYTHPDFVRRGVGRLIMQLCEEAARKEGFHRLELMATMAGAGLYRSCGFSDLEAVTDSRGGAPVPLTRMVKTIG